jgi:hypothetical protein
MIKRLHGIDKGHLAAAGLLSKLGMLPLPVVMRALAFVVLLVGKSFTGMADTCPDLQVRACFLVGIFDFKKPHLGSPLHAWRITTQIRG